MLICSFFVVQGYGTEQGVFCGVFDGHGKNGHLVSEMVRNRLPLLLLGLKNSNKKLSGEVNDIDPQNSFERMVSESEPTHNFHKWKQALITAFKVMDKEIQFQLQEYLDCSCSGATAVVALRQVGAFFRVSCFWTLTLNEK